MSLLQARRTPALVRHIAFAMIALLLAPCSRAGALEQLQDFLNNAKSARGEFTQQVMRNDGRVAESSSGRFAFARPGKFRWEVRQPFEQLLVADGERLYFYDRDLNQVTVKRLSEALGSTPAAILFGSADLQRQFELRELAPRDGREWLEALPRNKEPGFERIALGFRAGLPEVMEVHDAFGRLSRFEFKAIVPNAALGSDAFRFETPKGADVVQQ